MHHLEEESKTDDQFLDDLIIEPLQTVAKYYASCLANHPKASDFLQRHSLSSADGVAELEWMVGFSDRTLGKHIPKKQVKRGREIRSKLHEVGIYRANGREHFRGMVTVPLRSLEQQQLRVTGMFGLRMDRSNSGAPTQTIGSGIFNAQALLHFDELIVCHSVLDAWTLLAAGHRQAVCFGEVTPPAQYLSRIKRVVLASSDMDPASFPHCEVFAMQIPQGLTVHDYALEHSNELDPLAKFIRSAPWLKAAEQTAVDPPQPKKLNATPVPALPEDDLEVETTDTEVCITLDSRRWRIRNLERNQTPGVLRVNVLVLSQRTDGFHVDTFDLYHARSRRSFLNEAAEEIGEAEAALRSDIGRVLLKLEQLQLERLQAAQQQNARPTPQLTAEENAAALELLRSDNLLDRILQDFDQCGIVGEQTGKLVGYLAATSRLLDKPLGLIVQSSSAAGKSSLTNAILNFMPEEAQFTCSAMTSQSLYYLGRQDLRHRILAVAEEEGARNAAYGLKLLLSEGRLSLVSTSKEKGSGRMATQRYEVQGPISLMLTTTAADLDPELMNRCLVINVDESPAQTSAIQAQQRFARTFQGFQQGLLRQSIAQVHRNAQRLLKPLHIHNPFASQLGFAGTQTRFRRDHEKYLTLIHTITLLHQFQRETQRVEIKGQTIEYLEVTREDIARANRIAQWALGRSIDELPGPTRRLLSELFEWVQLEAKRQGVSPSKLTFTRRQARESLQWSATHFREQLERLVRAEYIVPHGRGQGKLHRYGLLYDGRGREGESAMLGLVDAAELTKPQSMPMTGHLALN